MWQKTAIFLAGIVVTGSIAWATYVRNAVTTTEVQQMIDTNMKTLQVQIDYQAKQFDSLLKQYETLNSKIDYIVQNPDRARSRP